ncbi:MAG: AraC family transcriptional regulator, partial [Pseudolabrys sp.]|nr:AraC family transcriptional regulator [Pseudolabrys sp.]
MSASSIKQDVDCANRENFHVACKTAVVGDLVLCQARANSVILHRKARHIASDGNDSVLILVRERGGPVGGRQFGREVEIGNGGAAVFDSKEESLTYGLDDGTAFAIYLPRAHLLTAGVEIEKQAAKPLDLAGTTPLRLAVSYAKCLLNEPPADDPQSATLAARHISDLFALGFDANSDFSQLAKSRGLRAVRLESIRQAIAKNFNRADLTADALAKMVQLSPRYIQHLLHEEGTTVSAEVTSLRLDRAFGALTDRARAQHSVSDIAYQCGFSDLSTFYRAFKRRYGMT